MEWWMLQVEIFLKMKMCCLAGANGRTNDDVAMMNVNKMYASVLKRGVWPKLNDAEKVKFAPSLTR
jgi:hypothetical protein